MEIMKKKSFFYFISALLIGTVLCVGCGQKEKAPEPTEDVKADSVVKADTVMPDQGLETTQKEMEEAKTFLESFYKGLDKDQLNYAFVKKHTTRNAIKYLADNYEYDCDGGDCLATWIFLYEGGGDTGPLKKRTFEMIDEATCKVSQTYEGYDSKDYKYIVKLGVVKDGDNYKIDTIEPLVGGND